MQSRHFLCATLKNVSERTGILPHFTILWNSPSSTISHQFHPTRTSPAFVPQTGKGDASCANKTYCFAPCTATRTSNMQTESNKRIITPYSGHSPRWFAKVHLHFLHDCHSRLLSQSSQMLSLRSKFATMFDKWSQKKLFSRTQTNCNKLCRKEWGPLRRTSSLQDTPKKEKNWRKLFTDLLEQFTPTWIEAFWWGIQSQNRPMDVVINFYEAIRCKRTLINSHKATRHKICGHTHRKNHW